MPTTPNMGLILPTPTVTPGPAYATQNNTAFTVVDSHNHTPGSGLQVPSDGLNINADLPFNSNNAVSLRTTRFADQGGAIGQPSDLGCLYIGGGELFYNDGLGNQIQITAGGALNAASIGGIGGDYSTSTASVFYTSATQTFTFWQNVNTPALMDMGPITLRPAAVSPFGITIQATPVLSADYDITFPNGLPASNKFVSIDAAGALAFVYGVDGTTVQLISNNLTAKISNTHVFKANGSYAVGNAVDDVFIVPYNCNIVSVWVYSGTAGSGGTTTLDLKVASTSGGAYASVLSTTASITSAAASGVWTDSNAIVGAQAGVTKPVVSTTAITAGSALRFDILAAMTGAKADCMLMVELQKT